MGLQWSTSVDLMQNSVDQSLTTMAQTLLGWFYYTIGGGVGFIFWSACYQHLGASDTYWLVDYPPPASLLATPPSPSPCYSFLHLSLPHLDFPPSSSSSSSPPVPSLFITPSSTSLHRFLFLLPRRCCSRLGRLAAAVGICNLLSLRAWLGTRKEIWASVDFGDISR